MTNKFLHLFSLLLLFLAFSSSHSGFAQPKIVLPNGTYVDLGTLYESNDTHYRISLRNDGTDTLRIRNVTHSCGCTTTQVRNESISPGDTGSIDVQLLNTDINGPSIRHVYILSNDTTTNTVDVTFGAKVLPVLRADPRYVSFGTVLLHGKATKILRLENTVGDTIRILSAHAGDARIHVSVEHATIPPHTSVNVRTVFNASSPEKLLGEIIFTTDSKLKPTAKVSYVGKIVRQ